MTRLTQRIQRLETQWRPQCIVNILRRVRQCAPAELGACLMAELTAVDRAMREAIMDQLADVELETLIGPDVAVFMDTLPSGELEALARGDPKATQRFQQSFERWRNGRP